MKKTAFTNVALYQQAAFQFGHGFYFRPSGEWGNLDPRGWWPTVRERLAVVPAT